MGFLRASGLGCRVLQFHALTFLTVFQGLERHKDFYIMKTFVAWSIANLELVLSALFVVLMVIFWQVGAVSGEMAFGVTCLVVFCAWMFSSIGGVGSGLSCILSLLMYGSIFVESKVTWLFWGMLIPSAIIAIAVAVFTARNMDEVVTRRMLYRNSNSSMFEITAKYTFNRFSTSFFYISCIILFLLLSLISDSK